MPLTECAASRFQWACALGHRCLRRIIGPSVTLTGLKEIQFFRRVVAVPITPVIGESIVSFHPRRQRSFEHRLQARRSPVVALTHNRAALRSSASSQTLHVEPLCHRSVPSA